MRALILLLLALSAGCAGDRTPTPAANFESAIPDHTKFTDPCSTCHESSRYPLVDNVVHGFGRDCAECHAYTPTTPWKPLPFSHFPKPKECLGCHPKDRPAAPHVQVLDCAGCHKFPTWLPAVP